MIFRANNKPDCCFTGFDDKWRYKVVDTGLFLSAPEAL